MRGFLFSAVLSVLIPFSAQGVEKEGPDERVEKLDSVVVSSSRAGKNTPVAFTMVGKEELRRSNPLNSLPGNLALQPSVVSVNEGGTGLGYSKMTVRGTKGSQINVTLNGITLNDAESQEVFWVNIPALSSMISSVQLQRGLGTSANGAGAFGASINMSTASVGADPFASADMALGSYGTFISTFAQVCSNPEFISMQHILEESLTDISVMPLRTSSRLWLCWDGWMERTHFV